jgi:hypothetical protein
LPQHSSPFCNNPAIHLEMLSRGYAFDTVQMPLNPLDANFRSFVSDVLPVAKERGIAALGMKSRGGSGELTSKGAFTPSQALSYAISLPVATTISGMDSMEVLDQNLTILRDFKTLSADRMQILRDHGKQFDDGRYELYKSTIKYNRDFGRSQHGYPSSAELPVWVYEDLSAGPTPYDTTQLNVLTFVGRHLPSKPRPRVIHHGCV